MEVTPGACGITSKIYPLALPRGTEKFCELCQGPATLQCTKCRVTFYCDAEHQQADWAGIHERICPLLIPIRTQSLCSLTKADQIHVELKKVELMGICMSVAQSKLSERKYEEALPAAQFCLRCSMDVHSPSANHLIPAYLLLAEANFGVSNLALVTELLSQAEWAVLKSPECGHEIYQRLHRSLGRLQVATGNLDAALLNFANDIYHASEAYGLDSTVACRGHFLMADVFAKQGKTAIACSMFSEVAGTWHTHLTKHIETHIQNVQPSFDKSQHTEVDETLRTVLEFWQNEDRKNSGQIALVAHCLAMLWFLGGDSQKALGFGNVALQASQLIPNHDLTEPIQTLLQLVQNPQREQHPGCN
ncbi:zinc finger MYND domain-containing protein 12 [Xyrichtys novacula]|uniref:Zinc finger MYND domain-containing protein 12 n=1 Tax=Xyrichtys novacula TaxID=13765 RepID=A0AAV1HK96_XYRNO|nr:zinc finger MYND domain-containing protein 12 [Xyrichtys novacula]